MTKELEISTSSVAETFALGRRLGALLGPGDVVALLGELGAGKTYLTKGIAEGLGVEDTRRVTSPSFVLVKEYAGRVHVYHLDAYRLKGAEELLAIGSDDILGGDGVSIVEWADRVAEAIPEERLEVEIAITGPESRAFTFRAFGRHYEETVAALK